MADPIGALFALRMNNTATVPVMTNVAGLRTKTISLNSEIVDVTVSESTGMWREILAGAGVSSASFSGAGRAVNKASLELIRGAFFDRSNRASEIVVPNFGTFTGNFRVSSFELSGEYNDSIDFDATFESAGVITFTAEA